MNAFWQISPSPFWRSQPHPRSERVTRRNAPRPRAPGGGRPAREARAGGQFDTATRRVVDNFWQGFGKISAKFRSFSAVSAPIFASKYAFCSIFQNLPDYLAEFFEIWQNLNFADFATFAKIC